MAVSSYDRDSTLDFWLKQADSCQDITNAMQDFAQVLAAARLTQ